MNTSRAIASAILLACIGIVAMASIEPIAGNMMDQSVVGQGMVISCPSNMYCKATMSMMPTMEQPMEAYCPANMTCMMSMMPMNKSENASTNKTVNASMNETVNAPMNKTAIAMMPTNETEQNKTIMQSKKMIPMMVMMSKM
ncbi:MAG: hypothetical protein WB392_04165 [Methanotrichaceae archaeon]